MSAHRIGKLVLSGLLILIAAGPLSALEILPPKEQIKTDHPRLLLRPEATPYAVSLEQLRGSTDAPEYAAMLDKLKQEKNAACQALVWQLTGDTAAGDTAVALLKRYRYARAGDTFDVYFPLMEYALAYDWIFNYPGFSPIDKINVRYQVGQLASIDGFTYSYDHIFHNYIWMSACGTALWALATAGEEARSDTVYDKVRDWLNNRLYPGSEYLQGLPSESLGYWSLYDFSGSVWPVLAAQSAFEQDLVGRIESEQGDWLRRAFLNVIHSVLPDMRYVPWGDVIGGPNGGVTHEMAGVLDALTWALNSGEGRHFSQWLAGKRGTGRFYGITEVFYMIYTKNLTIDPVEPPLSYVAGGGTQGGHFLARSSWTDTATVVSFGVKDHYGDHNHYDQGGFTVYRNELLATDPLVYNQVNGPQQPSDVHSTLQIKGPFSTLQNQRTVHGQDHGSLGDFKSNLTQNQKLDTGDFLFYGEGGGWAAASGQYTQAYTPDLVQSCVRQVLFVRPDKFIVVDQLKAPSGGSLTQVDWLMELAAAPDTADGRLTVSNGKSWLRCRPLLPQGSAPSFQATTVNTWRGRYSYPALDSLTLVHLLDTGDGAVPETGPEVEVKETAGALEVLLGGWTFTFSRSGDYKVTARRRFPGDVNADDKVDIYDLLSLLKVLGGIDTDPDRTANSDLNQDGRADIFDLLALLKIMAGGSSV